jgi:hypothetical protein
VGKEEAGLGPPVLDWTIAMDDAMCERFGGCTLCGHARQARLVIKHIGPLALAASLCARCDRQDPQQGRLDALLAARYDPQRWDGRSPA